MNGDIHSISALNRHDGFTALRSRRAANLVLSTLSLLAIAAVQAHGADLLEFSSPTYSVLEGNSATITVNRVGGAMGEVAVQVATSDGTGSNGVNYIGFTNTLTWANGETNAQSVAVQTLQNNSVGGNYTVNLSLFNPGATPLFPIRAMRF